VLVHDLSLILLITIGLAFALFFGAITNRLGLSPIVGYLFAGVMVGPYTPGFVGDQAIAGQLAELGVILLMFGVGLHFDIEELIQVRTVAIPGAIGQILAASILTTGIAVLLGLSATAGVILGIAVSVASTVVLVRVLMDHDVLQTPQGHTVVGWLIVEDLFTVIVLVLLPAIREAIAVGDPRGIAVSLAIKLLKLATLVVLVLVIGRRAVPWFMNAMARTRSRELFTLSVLVVALGIATGSALVFGVSMALGAFLAGIVVGQSDVSHQAASDALPMRDAFAVLFFISIGMLFNPAVSLAQWPLILAVLAVILVAKPLAAFGIVLLLRQPLRVALTAAIALAQIGEFSFIVADLARSLDLLPESGASVLVTCSIVSITMNPLLFRLIDPLERWLEGRAGRWRWLRRSEPFEAASPPAAPGSSDSPLPLALVVGHGPVGQTLTQLLRDFHLDPVVIDLNIDTVRRLRAGGVRAVYGDASNRNVLIAAGLESAEFLCITLAEQSARFPIIETALALRPELKLIVRAHYLQEREDLERAGVTAVAYEEAEVAVALAEILLRQIGVGAADIEARCEAIRAALAIRRIPSQPAK
jgi:CPA2 family monovalent cation:H+ antiporter-2